MRRTGGPARIDKRVMDKLLNLVDNPLFKVLWIGTGHPEASNRLTHRCFVPAPNGLHEIAVEQANHAVCVSL